MKINYPVKTRFAPSPTGFVHVGNLRTALYAYLFARSKAGSFLLRIEDTDKKRVVEGSIDKLFEALDWVGIEIDEGVCLENGKISEKGELGPYFQSKRLPLYKKHVDQLIKKGHAYNCFCSPERLDELRKKQQKNSQPPMYDKKCLGLEKGEIEKRIGAGEKHVVRLNVPREEIVAFNDLVYGKISVEGSTIDDQVLLKSDGFPTYHLAVVVDDHYMKISHIIRAEEWLPSTPKHVLLYGYLGWDLPKFLHVPNVLGDNHKKLSKRQGDVSVEDFKNKGYLPEALVNFLALIGWNPKSEREHFSIDELSRIFSEKGLHKAGGVFDYKKLDWMNAHYIKQLSDDALLEKCKPFLDEYLKKNDYAVGAEVLGKIVAVEKHRIKKLSDIAENINYYFAAPSYDKKLLSWKDMTSEETKNALGRSLGVIESISEDEFNREVLEEKLFAEAGDNRGELLWPLRAALSGEKHSSSPFEIAWVIGKDDTIKRIRSAKELLE